MKSLQPKTSQMLAQTCLEDGIWVNKIGWLFGENSHLVKREEAEDKLLLQSDEQRLMFVSVGGHSTLVQVLWTQTSMCQL